MLPKKPQRTYADNMLDLKIDSRNFDDFFLIVFFAYAHDVVWKLHYFLQ